jgi:hypothetical protein
LKKPVCNKTEAKMRLKTIKPELSALGVLKIGIFGSFAREQQSETSDIDILIEFSPNNHTFDNFMEATFLLEKTMGRKVEVVTPESLSPFIGPHILREVEHVPLIA